jgi:exosortase C (VPDSG-CTERM-specific)
MIPDASSQSPTPSAVPPIPSARLSPYQKLRTGWRALPAPHRRRFTIALAGLALLALAFCLPLWELFTYAAATDLHSHILLIPVVSAYLLALRWNRLPTTLGQSWFWAVALALVATAALLLALGTWPTGTRLSSNDRLAAFAASFVCLAWALGFGLLGSNWMRAAAFPLSFLVFLIPLPDGLTTALETASQHASAEATAWLYQLTGLPHLRDGLVFQLPGISLKVAQECSGIRSSWVLFITSLVAAEMFLESPWRRLILVALVIPLGILRNGFRILVIGWLCVEVGPHMIHSFIHHRGGPIFFVLSLIPLFAILWLLRRTEKSSRPEKPADREALSTGAQTDNS